MREPRDSDRGVTDAARGALFEITDAETVGPVIGVEDGTEGLVDVHFASTMPGYPGWRWTVSLSVLDADDPQVLETELTPGEGALLAPDWVPWADRLAEYRAAGHELPELADDDDHDDDHDDDDDDESDDVDGVDIDGVLEDHDHDHDESDDDASGHDVESDGADADDDGAAGDSELDAAHRVAAESRRGRDGRNADAARGGSAAGVDASAVDFDHEIVDLEAEAGVDPEALDPNEAADDDHGFGYVPR